MKTLGTNDWMVLNTIIYKIYTMENFGEMRRELLEQLKLLVNFDSADFYLASANGKKLEHPVMVKCETNLSGEYEKLDQERKIMCSGKTLIYRDTDIVPDEERTGKEYYQKIFKPNNWHYSLQMVIAKEKKLLGVIHLYRTIGKENFQYNDIFILDMLKDHLTYRMDKHKVGGFDDQKKLTVTEAVERYSLTKREHTILRMLMQGLESTLICEQLSISANTLKKHILNIYRKLRIKNRVQLFKKIKEREE